MSCRVGTHCLVPGLFLLVLPVLLPLLLSLLLLLLSNAGVAKF